VYSWQMLVDAFGDIPYSEALKAGADTPNLAPAYDDDVAIYTDLISRAQAAIAGLSNSGTGYTTDDLIFSGSSASWKKFGHSLLVKIGYRLFDQNAASSKSLIEGNYASAIASNGDNAYIQFEGAPPNTNPL